MQQKELFILLFISDRKRPISSYQPFIMEEHVIYLSDSLPCIHSITPKYQTLVQWLALQKCWCPHFSPRRVWMDQYSNGCTNDALSCTLDECINIYYRRIMKWYRTVFDEFCTVQWCLFDRNLYKQAYLTQVWLPIVLHRCMPLFHFKIVFHFQIRLRSTSYWLVQLSSATGKHSLPTPTTSVSLICVCMCMHLQGRARL